MNVNKTFLAGNITRTPETRSVGSTTLTKFGVATNRHYTANGEKKQEATFVDVLAWGKTGETIAKYLKKGDPIFIEGRLSFSSWEDKATGSKRSKLEVVCESFQFVGSTSKSNDAPSSEREPDYGDTPF